jgi:hypothetical protein
VIAIRSPVSITVVLKMTAGFKPFSMSPDQSENQPVFLDPLPECFGKILETPTLTVFQVSFSLVCDNCRSSGWIALLTCSGWGDHVYIKYEDDES